MNIINKNYFLETEKEIEDKTFVLASDLHADSSLSIKDIDKLVEAISKRMPDYIFLLGDILPLASLNDYELRGKVLYLLKLISNITKTYMVFGNNDYYLNKKRDILFATDKLLSLYDHSGVEVINNSVVESQSDINIIGYNKNPFLYLDEFKRIDRLREDLENLIAKVEDAINPLKYTVFLTHSHLDLLNLELDFLKTVDLILAGHTHNAVVPHLLEPIYPKNRGLYVNGKIFPDNTRGHIKEANQNIIVTGGLTKISSIHFNSFIRDISKIVYPAEITTVKVKGCKKISTN